MGMKPCNAEDFCCRVKEIITSKNCDRLVVAETLGGECYWHNRTDDRTDKCILCGKRGPEPGRLPGGNLYILYEPTSEYSGYGYWSDLVSSKYKDAGFHNAGDWKIVSKAREGRRLGWKPSDDIARRRF